jgi:hypothetical protein
MKYTVVGIGERLSGKSAKNGNQYDFTPIYCFCVSPNVVGHKTEEVSFSHLSKLTFPSQLAVGDIINVEYDKRGFMVGITILEKSDGKSNVKINITA